MEMKVERKIHNSLRIIFDSDGELQRRYENLTNLVLSYGGRIHGSQYQSEGRYGSYRLAVYFEIPSDSVTEFNNEDKSLNLALKAEIEARPKKRLPSAGGTL
jgi:hypothetical protein